MAYEKHNEDNSQSLSNWFDYLNEVKAYISNRVIALDYNSRYIRFPNGAFFIKDFDYNVGYTIKNNDQNQTYVYVFMMNFKAEEFGLKVPNVNESKRTITRKELKNIINECVDRCLKNYLKEQTLNETLNNFDAPLYHNTSMKNLIKMMSSNSIKSGYNRGYNTQDTHNGICFTRYKTYYPYTYYDVRLTFDVNKIGKLSRGLTLVSYQDNEGADVDEYEERLVSRNGKPFILNNLSDMITEVVIVLDRTCGYIIKSGSDVDDYIDYLKHITQYNIFGEKLKLVDNLKYMNKMSINDACDYIIDQCADDEYYNSYQVYCVEYYDVSDESWEYSEYTQNRNEAIKTAKQMYEDDGIPTRVTSGEYDGQEYELSSVVQKFGNVDW